MTEPAQPKSKKKFLIIPALIIAGILINYFFFTVGFKYSGTLEATKVDISSQVSSTINTVDVREGDHVKPTQKLLTLTCDDIKVADAIAAENYVRAAKLYKSGSTSQENFDQTKNRKDDADVRLGWCQVASPIQGTVLSRYHEPGELVNPGTKILTLANIRDIWAYIYVPQPEVSRIKPGMILKGHLPEMGDKVFEGSVLKVNEEAEFTPKNVQTRSERQRLVFGVKVGFLGHNDDEILKPGMTIEIDLPKDVTH